MTISVMFSRLPSPGARQLSRGQAASALEQQQQVDETAGTHAPMVAENMTKPVMYLRPSGHADKGSTLASGSAKTV